MKEKIYTIPVNEAFDRADRERECTCPFCLIYNQLEYNEIDAVLGPAMMEPDVRIKTNENGFCSTHFDMMFRKKRRLQLGLILESHLTQVAKGQKSTALANLKGAGTEQLKRLQVLENSCYVCTRIEDAFAKMLACAAMLWGDEREFREKTAKAPYFCLPHYKRFCESAKITLDKKKYNDFYAALSKQQNAYIEELNDDVSWFCKKFDYRYTDEPWKNSKDAPERALRFLSGDLHKNADD